MATNKVVEEGVLIEFCITLVIGAVGDRVAELFSKVEVRCQSLRYRPSFI